jgi:hypothetical protein
MSIKFDELISQHSDSLELKNIYSRFSNEINKF